MTNTREEVAVAEHEDALRTLYKFCVRGTNNPTAAETSMKKMRDSVKTLAAIAASNSKYVAGLVEALKDISTESVQGKCGICGTRCGSCITCDCQKGYWSQVTPAERAGEALNNLPDELKL